MRVNDYFACAGSGKKQKGKVLTVLMFFSFFLYFAINSLADSVSSGVDKIENIPSALTMIKFDDKEQSFCKELQKEAANDKNIIDVYSYVNELSVTTDGILKEKNIHLTIQAYSEGLQTYIYAGKKPAQNEILLPEYFYGYSEGRYIKGSDFIGKTVVFSVTDYNDEITEYEYLVSGTYDNIYAVTGNSLAYVPPEEAVHIAEVMKTGWESKLLEAMERNGNYDKQFYIGYEMEYKCAVCLKDKTCLEEFFQKHKYEDWLLLADTSENSIESMFEFVRFAGNIVTLVLLCLGAINMVLAINSEVNGRRTELAIYLTQGYTHKQISWIIALDYAARIIKAFFAAIVGAAVIICLANYFIKEKISMEYSVLYMYFSLKPLYLSTILFIILIFAGKFSAKDKIKKLQIVEILKSEG